MRVYFGTYTGGESKGIYVCSLNAETGELDNLELAAETKKSVVLGPPPERQVLIRRRRDRRLSGPESGSGYRFQN